MAFFELQDLAFRGNEINAMEASRLRVWVGTKWHGICANSIHQFLEILRNEDTADVVEDVATLPEMHLELGIQRKAPKRGSPHLPTATFFSVRCVGSLFQQRIASAVPHGLNCSIFDLSVIMMHAIDVMTRELF